MLFRKILLVPMLSTMLFAGGIEKDKQYHFAAGMLIGGFVTYRCEVEGIKHPKLWGFLAATTVGFLKEMSDRKEPGNKFDGVDWAYTGAGGYAGAVITFKIRF